MRLEQLAAFHEVSLDEFMSVSLPVLQMQADASYAYGMILQNQRIRSEAMNEKLDRLLDLMGKQIGLLTELVQKRA